MNIIDFIPTCILLHLIGGVIICLIASCSNIIGKCDNMEYLSPIWIYKNFKVNWFGAIVLAVFFNILVPAVSIAYWFCKLCTIGRK